MSRWETHPHHQQCPSHNSTPGSPLREAIRLVLHYNHRYVDDRLRPLPRSERPSSRSNSSSMTGGSFVPLHPLHSMTVSMGIDYEA